MLLPNPAGNLELVRGGRVEEAEPPVVHVEDQRTAVVAGASAGTQFNLLLRARSALRSEVNYEISYLDSPLRSSNHFSCLLDIQESIHCSLAPLGIPGVCFLYQTML